MLHKLEEQQQKESVSQASQSSHRSKKKKALQTNNKDLQLNQEHFSNADICSQQINKILDTPSIFSHGPSGKSSSKKQRLNNKRLSAQKIIVSGDNSHRSEVSFQQMTQSTNSPTKRRTTTSHFDVNQQPKEHKWQQSVTSRIVSKQVPLTGELAGGGTQQVSFLKESTNSFNRSKVAQSTQNFANLKEQSHQQIILSPSSTQTGTQHQQLALGVVGSSASHNLQGQQESYTFRNTQHFTSGQGSSTQIQNNDQMLLSASTKYGGSKTSLASVQQARSKHISGNQQQQVISRQQINYYKPSIQTNDNFQQNSQSSIQRHTKQVQYVTDPSKGQKSPFRRRPETARADNNLLDQQINSLKLQSRKNLQRFRKLHKRRNVPGVIMQNTDIPISQLEQEQDQVLTEQIQGSHKTLGQGSSRKARNLASANQQLMSSPSSMLFGVSSHIQKQIALVEQAMLQSSKQQKATASHRKLSTVIQQNQQRGQSSNQKQSRRNIPIFMSTHAKQGMLAIEDINISKKGGQPGGTLQSAQNFFKYRKNSSSSKKDALITKKAGVNFYMTSQNHAIQDKLLKGYNINNETDEEELQQQELSAINMFNSSTQQHQPQQLDLVGTSTSNNFGLINVQSTENFLDQIDEQTIRKDYEKISQLDNFDPSKIIKSPKVSKAVKEEIGFLKCSSLKLRLLKREYAKSKIETEYVPNYYKQPLSYYDSYIESLIQQLDRLAFSTQQFAVRSPRHANIKGEPRRFKNSGGYQGTKKTFQNQSPKLKSPLLQSNSSKTKSPDPQDMKQPVDLVDNQELEQNNINIEIQNNQNPPQSKPMSPPKLKYPRHKSSGGRQLHTTSTEPESLFKHFHKPDRDKLVKTKQFVEQHLVKRIERLKSIKEVAKVEHAKKRMVRDYYLKKKQDIILEKKNHAAYMIQNQFKLHKQRRFLNKMAELERIMKNQKPKSKSDLKNELMDMEAYMKNYFHQKIYLRVENEMRKIQIMFLKYQFSKKVKELFQQALTFNKLIKNSQMYERRFAYEFGFYRLKNMMQKDFKMKRRNQKRVNKYNWRLDRVQQKVKTTVFRMNFVIGILNRFYNKFLQEANMYTTYGVQNQGKKNFGKLATRELEIIIQLMEKQKTSENLLFKQASVQEIYVAYKGNPAIFNDKYLKSLNEAIREESPIKSQGNSAQDSRSHERQINQVSINLKMNNENQSKRSDSNSNSGNRLFEQKNTLQQTQKVQISTEKTPIFNRAGVNKSPTLDFHNQSNQSSLNVSNNQERKKSTKEGRRSRPPMNRASSKFFVHSPPPLNTNTSFDLQQQYMIDLKNMNPNYRGFVNVLKIEFDEKKMKDSEYILLRNVIDMTRKQKREFEYVEQQSPTKTMEKDQSSSSSSDKKERSESNEGRKRRVTRKETMTDAAKISQILSTSQDPKGYTSFLTLPEYKKTPQQKISTKFIQNLKRIVISNSYMDKKTMLAMAKKQRMEEMKQGIEHERKFLRRNKKQKQKKFVHDASLDALYEDFHKFWQLVTEDYNDEEQEDNQSEFIMPKKISSNNLGETSSVNFKFRADLIDEPSREVQTTNKSIVENTVTEDQSELVSVQDITQQTAEEQKEMELFLKKINHRKTMFPNAVIDIEKQTNYENFKQNVDMQVILNQCMRQKQPEASHQDDLNQSSLSKSKQSSQETVSVKTRSEKKILTAQASCNEIQKKLMSVKNNNYDFQLSSLEIRRILINIKNQDEEQTALKKQQKYQNFRQVKVKDAIKPSPIKKKESRADNVFGQVIKSNSRDLVIAQRQSRSSQNVNEKNTIQSGQNNYTSLMIGNQACEQDMISIKQIDTITQNDATQEGVVADIISSNENVTPTQKEQQQPSKTQTQIQKQPSNTSSVREFFVEPTSPIVNQGEIVQQNAEESTPERIMDIVLENQHADQQKQEPSPLNIQERGDSQSQDSNQQDNANM